MTDCNARNKILTAELLQQGYRYHTLRNTFSKLYRRRYGLVFKFSIGLKSLSQQGLSEPEFYSGLVYKLKKKTSSVRLTFQISSEKLSYVVALLFYVDGKQLRLCRDGPLTWPHFFLGRLSPPKRLTSTSCTYFPSN